MKTILAALLLAAFVAGCATDGPASGATASSRRIAPPKSSPASISFGGENRTRANFWNSR